MKKSTLFFFAICITIIASCQDDKTFDKEIKANAGITTTFLRFSDGTIMNTANLGSVTWESITGKPDFDLLYKPIGYVPTWAEITNKPTTIAGYGITNAMTTSHPANVITTTNITNWNTAFSWGNHSGLYRPVTWVPSWGDVTGKPTFATVAYSGSYQDLNNIPLTFAPTAHTHDYNTDITNKPPEQDLVDAISGLDYLPIPSKTTAQINALVMPVGSAGIVKDATLNVYKVYKDGIWSIVITGN